MKTKLREELFAIGMELVCDECGEITDKLIIDTARKKRICEKCARLENKKEKK